MDLSPGQIAANILHAAGESADPRPTPGTIAVALAAKDEDHLLALSAALDRASIRHQHVIEDEVRILGRRGIELDVYAYCVRRSAMSIDYLKHATAPATQREQAAPGQVPNSAGGFSFEVTDWTRLDRFLVLGSEGGSYYASEQKLTRQNAKCVERLIKLDGPRLVARIVEISESGRAPKNDPAILALAMAARLGDPGTKTVAYAALPKVCRIGTHLYHFVQFADQLGGWGRGLRRAVSSWFNGKSASDLAYQLVKYQARDGWSSRDVLRLSHAKPTTPDHDALFQWATAGFDETSAAGKILPPIVQAFEEAKTATDSKRIIQLITDYRLPRECVPTQWLTKPEIWEAMLPHLGLTAVFRNLATMTRIGLLVPMGKATAGVVGKLTDVESLAKSRVHPIQVLSAMKTYAQGHGERGGNTWMPVQPIVDALDAAFYASFANVRPTGKRTLLALDVSSSMTWGAIAGLTGITPRIGSAAMALVTAAVEPNHHIMGFSNKLVDVPISPKMRLDQVIQAIERVPMGGTDCSLPMQWASSQLKAKVGVDAFAVYTDSETWAGSMHPHVALQKYRQQSGIPAKSVVVGMLANAFTLADPNDPGMLDVCGFDSAVPAIIADFFRE